MSHNICVYAIAVIFLIATVPSLAVQQRMRSGGYWCFHRIKIACFAGRCNEKLENISSAMNATCFPCFQNQRLFQAYQVC